MLKEGLVLIKEFSGVFSLFFLLFIWFYRLGRYASKVDMIYEVVINNIKLVSLNPYSPQKLFSSLPSKKQKYIEKISAKEESLGWKVSTIIGTIGLSKIKKWSGQTDALIILKCLIGKINEYSPPPNQSKNHSSNTNKSGSS